MTCFINDRKALLGALIFLILVSLQAMVAFADENKDVQVFEVRKRLQMSSKDPIIHDYYVNAGTSLGLKTGALIDVYRKVPLADPYKQETQSHVELPVGIMKIIYSDRTMAIGRIQSIRSTKDSPILDGEVFMVGDRLNLGTIKFEAINDDGDKKQKAESQAKSNDSKPKADESKTKLNESQDQARNSASLEPVQPPSIDQKLSPQVIIK